MHSIETIEKINTREIERVAGNWASSYFVVKVYNGLNFIHAEKFDTFADASFYADLQKNESIGVKTVIQNPLIN